MRDIVSVGSAKETAQSRRKNENNKKWLANLRGKRFCIIRQPRLYRWNSNKDSFLQDSCENDVRSRCHESAIIWQDWQRMRRSFRAIGLPTLNAILLHPVSYNRFQNPDTRDFSAEVQLMGTSVRPASVENQFPNTVMFEAQKVRDGRMSSQTSTMFDDSRIQGLDWLLIDRRVRDICSMLQRQAGMRN